MGRTRERSKASRIGVKSGAFSLVGTPLSQDLIRAGIREVDVFMSLTSSDTANILSAQAAKQVFSVEVVVCRVDDRALQSMYEEMGLITIGATSLLFDIAVHSATA